MAPVKISAKIDDERDVLGYRSKVKREVQLDLFVKPKRKRRRTKGVRWGRPPKGARAGSPHKERPALNKRNAVHVVLRVASDIKSLRKRHIYRALREATITVAKRELSFAVTGAFRIVHISIQRSHLHLLVEADDRMALSRGMQSFQISAAKHINRALSAQRGERRRGSVFPDRFHQEIISNPTQARRALSYVLNNWRKHREDRDGEAAGWNVDPFSTGALFPDWKEQPDGGFVWKWRPTYDPMIVYLPQTWLLRSGYKIHGLVSCREVPSARPSR